MAINSAIDNLLQNGYAVGGYSSSQIYLSDVTQFGMFWPEAVMYYDGGRFAGGRFYYSTPGFDRARFDVAYNYLTGVYGMPVSSTQSSGSLAVTWYGAGNQYITLTFEPLLTDAGRRYFTTLSLGY